MFSRPFAIMLLIVMVSCIYAREIKILQPTIEKLGNLNDEQMNARYTKCVTELNRVMESKQEECSNDIGCYKKNESAATQKCIEEFLNDDFLDCPEGADPFLLTGCGDDGRWDGGYEFSDMKASSTLKPQGSNNYDVKNLSQLTVLSAWSEGIVGYGIGETISVTMPDIGNIPILGIRIINGYSKSKSAYYNNSRVKELLVYQNGKPVAKLQLKDIPDALQNFSMNLSSGDKIIFEIVDVYKGKKYDDTLLTLLTFWTQVY